MHTRLINVDSFCVWFLEKTMGGDNFVKLSPPPAQEKLDTWIQEGRLHSQQLIDKGQ